MDELDRLYRRLVQNIRGAAPELLTRPFEVSQIHQELIPYRTNRRELGFDSNEEYELALMQLLGGLRGYITGDAELQKVMRAELSSPNPDLAAFRIYATSVVALAPEPLRAMEHELAPRPDANAPGTPRANAADPTALAARAARATEAFEATPSAPLPSPPALHTRPRASTTSAAPLQELRSAEQTSALEPARTRTSAPDPVRGEPSRAKSAGSGHGCRYCGGTLPDGRKITFCPHCGHNLTVQHCPACATELEVEWKFCITCGRDVA